MTVPYSIRQMGLIAALAGLGLSGCCTSGPCLDKMSSPDYQRVKARRAPLGKVINDSVSGPKRDLTDWKYVLLSKPGKLTVELHWDNGAAKLMLHVYDMMGVGIQRGRAWGIGGLRAVVAVEEPGRYFIRVRAAGKDDGSAYSLRLRYKPDREGGGGVCHDCQPGDRKCLGEQSYVVCEKVSKTCNAWAKPIPCPDDVTCEDGQCGSCEDACKPGSRRCDSRRSYKVCQAGESGCPVWGPTIRCGKDRRCYRGRCRKRGQRSTTRPPDPEPAKQKHVTCTIISIYKYRGRMTLHLSCGENAKRIKPGLMGYVLEGATGKKLPGGDIKVIRVTGRFAIARTELEELGKNRTVRVFPR